MGNASGAHLMAALAVGMSPPQPLALAWTLFPGSGPFHMPGLERQNWQPPASWGPRQLLGNEGKTVTSNWKVWAAVTQGPHVPEGGPRRRGQTPTAKT